METKEIRKNRRKAVKLPDSDAFNSYGTLGSIQNQREAVMALSKRIGDLEIQIAKLNAVTFGEFKIKEKL